MEFRKCTEDEMHRALAVANEQYEGNLRIAPEFKRGAYQTRLFARSGKIGARTSWQGRNIPAASWEAHRDFLKALFDINPNASVRTRFAHYNGKDKFYELYPPTAHVNIGSQMNWVTMPELTVEPEPKQKRRLKKNARAAFFAVANAVRKDLRTRMLVGEWDSEGDKFLPPDECWKVLVLLADRINHINHRRRLAIADMFPHADWVTTEEAAPLFQLRPHYIFGKEQDIADEPKTSEERFEATKFAALRYWTKAFECDDWYETIGEKDDNQQDR